MGKTYTNSVNANEVALGIEHFLIAHGASASWTVGRLDIDSPPANFAWLGAVVEDSPSLKASRKKFTIDAGIPSVRQYECIIGLEASLEAKFHTNSWQKFRYMLGNYTYSSPSSGGVVRQAIGSSQILYYTLLGVADLIDGVQIIHHFPKVTPSADVMEEIKGNENIRMPLKFEAFGVITTLYGGSELIVAERIYIPSTT